MTKRPFSEQGSYPIGLNIKQRSTKRVLKYVNNCTLNQIVKMYNFKCYYQVMKAYAQQMMTVTCSILTLTLRIMSLKLFTCFVLILTFCEFIAINVAENSVRKGFY